LVRIKTQVLGSKSDIFFYGLSHDLAVGILEDHSHSLSYLTRHTDGIHSLHLNCAGRGLEQPVQMTDEGRFTASVRTTDEEKLTVGNREINVLEGKGSVRISIG
jgi:hypothetical protein